MLSWLKKYFIPHNQNSHQPHILRRESIFFLSLIALVLEFFLLSQIFLLLPTKKYLAVILPSVLVDLTNQSRGFSDKPFLAINPLLEKAAQAKAEDMAANDYFAHTRSDGLTPWDFIEKAGYQFRYVGENLAVNFFDSQDIIKAWLASPRHRANILNSNFTEIGIGIAEGFYKGKNGIFIVQFFGQPLFQNRPVIGPRLDASLIGRLLVSPRQSIISFNIFLAIFIIAALALKIFVKIKIQHPQLIINGLLFLIFIIGLIFLNQSILPVSARIL